jgi:hypothetical protein
MRRSRSSRELTNSARDLSKPKNVAERLEHVEDLVAEIGRAFEVQSRRLTALEAQLDYLASKVRPA